MSNKWKALIDLGIDLAVAYHETREPRKPVLAADGVLLGVSALMLLVAVGLGLAAAFWAMEPALGPAIASLLTAVIAVGIAGVAFGASRLLMRQEQ
ncbi:MAG: hypothetical protein ACOCVI_03110 [Planctomycetota bacterium]